MKDTLRNINMPLFSYLNFEPKLGKDVFIAPGASIIGRVNLADKVNIWFNTVIRGDVNKIEIDSNTNIQDLSMLHVTEENPLLIGKNVTIGHSVILHACTIKDGCLIGMGAKILDGAIIGENSLVAAGSVVPPGKEFPPESFIIGSPAKLKRKLSQEEIGQYSNHYKSYLGYADQFRDPSKMKELF